jgi:hypothetical protein
MCNILRATSLQEVKDVRASFRRSQERAAGRTSARRRDGGSDPHEHSPRPSPELEPAQRMRRPGGPEERERRTGGPQDKALYVCRCGSAFQAPVTASVRCPHCGDAQAW